MSCSRAHSCKHPVNYLSWIKAVSYENIYLKTEQRIFIAEMVMHMIAGIEMNWITCKFWVRLTHIGTVQHLHIWTSKNSCLVFFLIFLRVVFHCTKLIWCPTQFTACKKQLWKGQGGCLMHCITVRFPSHMYSTEHKYVTNRTCFYIVSRCRSSTDCKKRARQRSLTVPPCPHFNHSSSIRSCAIKDCLFQTPNELPKQDSYWSMLLKVPHTFAYKHVHIDTLGKLNFIYDIYHVSRTMETYKKIHTQQSG